MKVIYCTLLTCTLVQHNCCCVYFITQAHNSQAHRSASVQAAFGAVASGDENATGPGPSVAGAPTIAVSSVSQATYKAWKQAQLGSYMLMYLLDSCQLIY